MRKKLELLNLIEKENITLDEELKIPDTSGIYINIPGLNPIIGIKKNLNSTSEYYSIIAEELGHHFKTIGNLLVKEDSYIKEVFKTKEEIKARLWAANFFITDEEFEQALHNCISTIPDMCDYFNVTREIINYKILSIIINEEKYNKMKNNFKLHQTPYEACNI